MGDTSETNTKVLSRELFVAVAALKTPKQKNHYLREMVLFPKYCHIYIFFVDKRSLNQVVFSDKYYNMYSKFTSYIFSLQLLCIREVYVNKYHYCAIFFQSLSIYTITDTITDS